MNHRNNGMILQKIATNVLLVLVVSYQFSHASPFKQTPAYLLRPVSIKANPSENQRPANSEHAQ